MSAEKIATLRAEREKIMLAVNEGRDAARALSVEIKALEDEAHDERIRAKLRGKPKAGDVSVKVQPAKIGAAGQKTP